MNDITVSIFILTYNQEHFIAQTIESILMQKTNFKYQLVIGEDCSTDNTRIICEKYVVYNASRIKLLPSLDKNIGLIANYMRTIKECDGKYIAICDGDDYWIDENKLQKQVDCLEQNPQFSIVYTNVRKLFPNGEIKDSFVLGQKQNSSFEDLIFDNFIPSVSVLFKNIQKESEFPDWIVNFPYGDWPTYLWTIKDRGEIYFLDEVTAIYRMDIGVSAKIRNVNSAILKFNLGILTYIANDNSFSNKRKVIAESVFRKKNDLMASFNIEKKYVSSLKMLFHLLKNDSKKYSVIKLYLFSVFKAFKNSIFLSSFS